MSTPLPLDRMPADRPPVLRRLVVRRDLAGATWTHPDRSYLRRWVARRNLLLKTLASAARSNAGDGPTR